MKAVIFSHLHSDHTGDAEKVGFSNAEMWTGPSTCPSVRPGYPAEDNSMVFSTDLPKGGSKKIVEFTLPPSQLDEERKTAIENALNRGNYEGM